MNVNETSSCMPKSKIKITSSSQSSEIYNSNEVSYNINEKRGDMTTNSAFSINNKFNTSSVSDELLDIYSKKNTLSPEVSNLFNRSKKNIQTANKDGRDIALSFQIMTRAEPIEVVVATIKSLLAIKSDDDEILIIDNNNTATELYEPLADFCNGLDSSQKVRFYHVDQVANFKSGALNLALSLMDNTCSHIVVVDSDYQALRHARMAIAAAIKSHPTHALLQFPQFYRDEAHNDVHSELNHYFNYHLYRPFNRQRALSTGTFAVIRRAALIELGGWSGASITEDAQMGVLMHQQGLKSQFIPEVIATGLLPTTLPDLLNQRQRWIYGNMQVLTSYFSTANHDSLITDNLISRSVSSLENGNKKNSSYERLAYIRAHFSQLSAWINFTGIFILAQLAILLTLSAALVLNLKADLSLLLTPLYLVYASYGFFLGRRLWAYSRDTAPLNQQVNDNDFNSKAYENANHSTSSDNKFQHFKKQIRAWLLHLNFWELGALSWIPVLWGRDKPFVCTPKQTFDSTARSTFLANLSALPKLLLGLNVLTALLVAPFSPLYSPALFTCALIICLVKLLATTVIFDNYRYQPLDTQIINFKAISNKKALLTPTKNVISLSKNVSNNLSKNKTINNKFTNNEAANS